jgi:hypothetical protein
MIPGKAAAWSAPRNDFGPVQYYTDRTPAHRRNTTGSGWFQEYMIGVGGRCSVYDPPVSYWCSEHPAGGGAFAFRTPSGVAVPPNLLPNAPYKDVDDMIVNVWRPARWANWMFEVKDYNASSQNFTFGKGGFQGARGENTGGDFFVENVLEELDSPGEFYFDKKLKKLYLYYNGTGSPPSDMEVVATQLRVLVNMTGDNCGAAAHEKNCEPVKRVRLQGLGFRATRYTYMDPHGVPSAGDWALDRTAAVFLQGTSNVSISGCTFERLDGNAVMFSGLNRNGTVEDSDFAYIGGNAMVAWGFTNETVGDGHPAAGVDGTDGNHPRFTQILRNTAREIGLYEKQSSFFVQAKTSESRILGNVFFNGPRAGINMNDGFGGGDEIAHNLVFSTCRESGDHGPFNSWDRQPFLTTVRTGEPSMIMQWREIHHNFFIDNYSPQENVDNDDGSAFYKTHHNFLVYGQTGLKADFGGHDNWHTDNLYAYLDSPLGIGTVMLNEHEDHFQRNKVIQTSSLVGSFICDGAGKTVMDNNAYHTPNGRLAVCCFHRGQRTLSACNTSFEDWQARGNERGSFVHVLPSDQDIIRWAREILDDGVLHGNHLNSEVVL